MEDTLKRPGFWRRCAAAFYDALLASAVFLLSGFIAVGVFMGVVELGLIRGVPHFSDLNQNPFWQICFVVWIRCVTFSCMVFFYVWFWAKGQTLGMKAWKLQLCCSKGQSLTKKRTFMRFCWSFLGLGNLLMLIRKDRKALQDCMTRTQIIHL